jgi:hypothetical protein
MKIDIPDNLIRELVNMTDDPQGEKASLLSGLIQRQVMDFLLATSQEISKVMPPEPTKRHISAEGRVRIAKAQKQRWARIRAQKK